MTKRGLFVTFEGLDGCGKTTQMRLLGDRLRERGLNVIEAVEPGGTVIGQGIRRILLDPAHHGMDPITEMLLYFAARAQNVTEIVEPALAAGSIVLSDRWTDSTFAYQGFGRQLGGEIVDQLDAIACRGRKPDITFFIEIDLDASLSRARRRNVEDANTATRMDDQSRAFFARVQQGYEALVAREPRRVFRIDGRGTPEEVAARVAAVFDNV